MAIRLTITYDGDVRGLSEHRISLSQFGPAFGELLKAFRRTGSNILTAAVGEDNVDTATGRLHKQAAWLDLELVAVHGGCARPEFLATQISGIQQELFNDLPRRAADRLLQDIEAESKAQLQSSVVRQYFAALPPGIRRQEYVLYDGDEEVRRVAFGEPQLASVPGQLPRLLRTTGTVIGLGFLPGDPYVEIMPTGKAKAVLCTATPDQVEAALPLRGKPVEIAAVVDARTRLLWLRSGETPFKAPPPEVRLARIHASWSETLRVLAQ